MDVIGAYLSSVWESVAGSQGRLYWPFLLTALIAAAISYALYAQERFSWKRFVHYALPKGTLTNRSARIDYLIVALTPLWFVFFMAPAVMGFVALVDSTAQGFTAVFGVSSLTYPGLYGLIIYSFVLFLFFDFSEFLIHYLHHRVWFLWEFHKIHHSAETMNPLTAYRFHPVELFLVTLTVALFTGVCQGFFHWLWNIEPQPYKIFGLELGVLLFYLAAYNLRHSHVWLPYPRKVSYIFMSPAQHQIHHSVERKHWNKNMGFVLSVWDWMFGTLYVPQQREHLQYGIGNHEEAEYQSPVSVYTLPFVKIARRLGQSMRSAREKTQPVGQIHPATTQQVEKSE